MKVSEFGILCPEYAVDFAAQVRDQIRIYDGAILDRLPLELEPEHPYHAGSRGRPNLNQTLAHSQCATCKRVLRNDLFYTPPSAKRRNLVHSHCRACTQLLNAARYDARADLIRARRIAIWQYLAPRCLVCGFDGHISAMDMHHLEQKEGQIAELITHVTFTVEVSKIEVLLREASKCIPLCSNCHRMLHAGAINLPSDAPKPDYAIVEILTRLTSLT